MHFVDKQNLAIPHVRQDGRQIALDLERGPRSLLEGDSELIRDDVGERGLTEAGRSVEQNVIERLAARASRFNGHRKIFFHLGLSDELIELLRAQLEFKRGIILDRRRRDDAVFQVGIVLCESHCRRC